MEYSKKRVEKASLQALRLSYKNAGQQDSNGETKARAMGYSFLPELEINGASPPRFSYKML